jgi:esterase/lipase
MRPDEMDYLAQGLADMGSDAFRIALPGSDRPGTKPVQVSREQWLEAMIPAYREARARADELNCPLHFLGFSLGAAVMTDLLSRDDVKVDRAVWLSPAMTPRRATHLLKGLRSFGWWRIPSATPKDYRACDGVRVGTYTALFKVEEAVHRSGYRGANIPTLVIFTPGDELVNIGRLMDDVRRYNLDEFVFMKVSNKKTTLPKRPSHNHLNTDEEAVGAQEMYKILKAIAQHLGLRPTAPTAHG